MPDIKLGEKCGFLKETFGLCSAPPLGSGMVKEAAATLGNRKSQIDAAIESATGGEPAAPAAPASKPMEIKF